MIAYTIVSRAYVPHARVLARSYAEHHQGQKLWALLIDDVDRQFDETQEPFHILRLSDLDLDQDEIHRMAMLFSSKLIAVIKPWVFAHFIAQGAESVLYIDGDFVIYDSLDPIAEAAGTGVILVPHVLHPLPRDGQDPTETTMLGAGMYNAGMFGAGRDHGGFIEFLQDRLRRECVFNAQAMRFNEQRWLDFVPSLFPHYVVRDPGVDVAYWNLHERPLESRHGQWHAGGAPLRAFHFSSFDPRTPGSVGRYELDPHPRIRVSSDPLLGQLVDDYARRLLDAGFEELHDTPFWFDRLSDGVPVYESMRDLFTSAVARADDGTDQYPPDPFDPASRQAFGEWLQGEYAQAEQAVPRRVAGSGADRLPPAKWSADWLGQMIVDPAADRVRGGGLRVSPQRVGFVCHGPRAVLSPGPYRAVLEWVVHSSGEVAADDHVLVIEAFIRGYAVGSRSATLDDVSQGEVVLTISIPKEYLHDAVLFGIELRVLTRGGLDATLAAVILEAVEGEGTELAPLSVDWLPVMAGGTAGRRQGREVVTRREQVGTIVSGPNWRLVPGRYQVDVGTRLHRPHPRGRGQVGVVEVVVSDRVLAAAPLSSADLARGSTQVEFDVDAAAAGPHEQIGVTVRSLVPMQAAVTSVHVQRVGAADRSGLGVA